jgi:hypothetical protein
MLKEFSWEDHPDLNKRRREASSNAKLLTMSLSCIPILVALIAGYHAEVSGEGRGALGAIVIGALCFVVLIIIATGIGFGSRESSLQEEGKRRLEREHQRELSSYNEQVSTINKRFNDAKAQHEWDYLRVHQAEVAAHAEHREMTILKEKRYREQVISYIAHVLYFRMSLKKYNRAKSIWSKLWICRSCSKRWGNKDLREQFNSRNVDAEVLRQIFPDLDGAEN